jgi:hypothetical protein
MKHIILSFILTNVIILSLCAQEKPVFENQIYDSDIHSVRIHQKDWELSWSYYELGSNIPLVFSFDDLKEDPRDFDYRIVHCNKDWTQSDLFYSDYIDGFEYNHIEDYTPSINTFIPYTHYHLNLPNRDVKFRISGNYAILVFDSNNNEVPLLIRRFIVTEKEIGINGAVHQPTMGLYKNLGHHIRFSLKTNYMQFNNIFDDLDVCILQNWQWDMVKCDIQPDFVRNDEVVFNRDDQAVFQAINEYRILNMRNLKFTNDKMANIEFNHPNYHITLYPDKDNQFMQYLDHEDFNGHYVISNRDGWEETAMTDADYAYVHFQVPSRINLMPATLHVYGELSNWQCDKSSEMTYNAKTGMYEKTMLLKQGAYSYRFVLKENGVTNHMRFEGSHWETENDYLIIIYYHDARLGADRIIGFQQLKSHPE